MNLSSSYKLAHLWRFNLKSFKYKHILFKRFCYSQLYSRFSFSHLNYFSNQIKSDNLKKLCCYNNASFLDINLYEMITQETLDSLAERLEDLVEQNDILSDADVNLSVSLTLN